MDCRGTFYAVLCLCCCVMATFQSVAVAELGIKSPIEYLQV